RVPAKIEEIIGDPHLVDAKHLLPDFRHHRFSLIARRDINVLPGRLWVGCAFRMWPAGPRRAGFTLDPEVVSCVEVAGGNNHLTFGHQAGRAPESFEAFR